MEDVYEGEENVFWLIVRADEVLMTYRFCANGSKKSNAKGKKLTERGAKIAGKGEKVHFFSKKFGQFKKKQYLCSRFYV